MRKIKKKYGEYLYTRHLKVRKNMMEVAIVKEVLLVETVIWA